MKSTIPQDFDYEGFVQVWMREVLSPRSGSRKLIAESYGISLRQLDNICNRLRRSGVNLPRMPVVKSSPVDTRKLNNLIEELQAREAKTRGRHE